LKNRQALFITKKIEGINGRKIYSRELIDNLHNLSSLNIRYFDLEKKGVFQDVLLRFIYLIFLLPPAWRTGFYILGDSLRLMKELDKYKYIFVDHMQLWWFGVLAKICVSADVKIIFISHNLEWRAKLSYIKYGTIFYKLAAMIELGPMYVWEYICSKISDGIICINDYEKKFYESIKSKDKTYLVYPQLEEESLNKIKNVNCNSSKIVLVGSYNYKAKELNALWLIKEVMPHLHKYKSEIELNIVGRGVTSSMIKASKNKPFVNIVGEVKSLTPYYADCFSAIIPEKMGGGFKLKIIEAAIHKRPMIMHEEAYRGTAFEKNKDCLVFNDKKNCVKMILLLYQNRCLQSLIVKNAVETLKKNHLKNSAKNSLEEIFKN
jgi:hypothetical protein